MAPVGADTRSLIANGYFMVSAPETVFRLDGRAKSCLQAIGTYGEPAA